MYHKLLSYDLKRIKQLIQNNIDFFLSNSLLKITIQIYYIVINVEGRNV